VVPPLTGEAVNVTEVPEQIGLDDATAVTLTVRLALTAMVTVFEVAGFPDAHVAFEVRTQDIASLLSGT
jgi:hypothetical protein